MKIVVLALIVGLVGLIDANSGNLIQFAPSIPGGECTSEGGCVVPHGQELVCAFDQRQERESLKNFIQELIGNISDAQEIQKTVKVLDHFGLFNLRLMDSKLVLKEKKLPKPFEGTKDADCIENKILQDTADQFIEFSKDWSIKIDSTTMDISKTYSCCFEADLDVQSDQKPEERLYKICTQIRFKKPCKLEQQEIELADDNEDVASMTEKLSSKFNDIVEFVKKDKSRHSEYFIPLVIATVAMVILVVISTVFCIVTIIFEVCCHPRGGKNYFQKSKKHLRIVNEDSFQFDCPGYETTANAINLPCTITEYLRQIEASPTTSTINIRQQHEIAPPSYLDSMKTQEENEYAFNMTMKF